MGIHTPLNRLQFSVKLVLFTLPGVLSKTCTQTALPPTLQFDWATLIYLFPTETPVRSDKFGEWLNQAMATHYHSTSKNNPPLSFNQSNWLRRALVFFTKIIPRASNGLFRDWMHKRYLDMMTGPPTKRHHMCEVRSV